MRVLILGGGGTLGAFSAGALVAIESMGWKPEVEIGSSAGGINLLRAAVGGPQAAVEFWRDLSWQKLLREALRDNPFNGGLLAESRFYERVEAGVDFGKLLLDTRAINFLVVDFETGKVSLRGNRTEADIETLRGVSRAAYSLPPLLPPIRVHDKLLGDGGLLYNAPLELALKMGATQIVYLCNVQVTPYAGFSKTSTFPATRRYLDIFFRRASNVGFANAEVVEGTYHGVPFLAFAPPAEPSLFGLLQSMRPTRGQLDRLIALGEARAREALAVTPWVLRPEDANASRVV